MLKLIDGLQTTGRNKELIATGRQFLVRHPADPACVNIERLAGETPPPKLATRRTRPRFKSALETSQGNPEGQRSGRDAIALYFAINNPESLAKAAALAEDMLDKLPAGGRDGSWLERSTRRNA